MFTTTTIPTNLFQIRESITCLKALIEDNEKCFWAKELDYVKSSINVAIIHLNLIEKTFEESELFNAEQI